MPRTPMGGGDGFAVTPERLRETAPHFDKASQDTATLEASLSNDANQLINDMSTVLHQSPASLQQFFNSWRSAMLSLSDSLSTVGYNLLAAADGYEMSESLSDNSFQPRQGRPF